MGKGGALLVRAADVAVAAVGAAVVVLLLGAPLLGTAVVVVDWLTRP